MSKPLTLNELRHMNGEPIYVMPLTGDEKPHWEICTYNLYDLSVYGDAWVAYKEKLENCYGEATCWIPLPAPSEEEP